MTTSEILEDHGPGQRDLAGWPRCSSCGYRYPCPSVRATLPAQTAAEMEVVALVDLGWTLWKAKPGSRDSWDDTADVGGIVTGWWEEPSVSDRPDRRIYRCLDFPHGKHDIVSIPADEVDVTAAALPNPATIRRAARKLCAEIGKRKGVVSSYELDLLADALTLMRTIA